MTDSQSNESSSHMTDSQSNESSSHMTNSQSNWSSFSTLPVTGCHMTHFGRSKVIGSLCSSGLESAYSLYPSLSKLLCLLELEEAGSEVNRLGFLAFECEKIKFVLLELVTHRVFFPTPMHTYTLHTHTHTHTHT